MVRCQNYELKGQTSETASAQAAQCSENLTSFIIPARLQTRIQETLENNNSGVASRDFCCSV